MGATIPVIAGADHGSTGDNVPGYNLSALAHAISPDCKPDEQKVDNHKCRHVALPADAKPVTVQSFPENKVHTVPRHQHREKTDHARDDQTKLRPPTGQPPVQRCDITE